MLYYGLPGTCIHPHRVGWRVEHLAVLCSDLLTVNSHIRVTIFSCNNITIASKEIEK